MYHRRNEENHATCTHLLPAKGVIERCMFQPMTAASTSRFTSRPVSKNSQLHPRFCSTCTLTADMASASASADFYTTFQSLKQGQFNSIAPRPTQAQDLRDVNPVGSITATQVGVEKLTKSDVLSALEPGQGVSEPSKRLTKLKVELGRALPSLPAYDQRSYDLVRSFPFPSVCYASFLAKSRAACAFAMGCRVRG
jgi:hypothetical protein